MGDLGGGRLRKYVMVMAGQEVDGLKSASQKRWEMGQRLFFGWVCG
jgi:hypothetical protein